MYSKMLSQATYALNSNRDNLTLKIVYVYEYSAKYRYVYKYLMRLNVVHDKQ